MHGSSGRMGQAIIKEAEVTDGVEIAAEVDIGIDLAANIDQADVIIDFSLHSATQGLFELAVEKGKPLVVGTTGHSPEERVKLRELAARVPTVWAGNFSIGVNLLYFLTQRASEILSMDYDAEIVEMHHRFKKDAPSGTAARLAEIVLEKRNLKASDLRHGREGITGERTQREVGMHSLRGGDVVGEHTVSFAALGERLELTHKASDRRIFAAGAIRSAEWIVGQPAGIYDMQDVLGLKA
jgi:4-hydroxy-tetrahydrodipicolinate reductase